MHYTGPVTDWSSRPDGTALGPEDLAALLDQTLDSSLGMLFTATPRAELDEIGRFQRLQDQAWAGQVRAIVAAYNRASDAEREFAADEVALAIGASPTAGSRLLDTALDVAGLPGLLEAVEAGWLTSRHALAVVAELGTVALSVEQRHAIVLMALARYQGQTPGELSKLIARLILQIDLAAAQLRHDQATRTRHVTVRRDIDGQAVLSARGPLEKIAAIKARLTAELDRQNLDPDDTRSRAQREFDLFTELLTTGTLDGQGVADYTVAVVVPFTVAAGGDLELAELPGYGPILPSTARDLLHQATELTQVAVDEHGVVLAVSDPQPGPARHAAQATLPDAPDGAPDEVEDLLTAALRRMTVSPVYRDLSTSSYRIPARLRRYVEARDRTCVFPGCHRPAARTDKDHRIPWPLGPTTPDNLQSLCRHHHRAKQTSFTITLDTTMNTSGYQWTTRGGWRFNRRLQGY
jgi:hypothetical protein